MVYGFELMRSIFIIHDNFLVLNVLFKKLSLVAKIRAISYMNNVDEVLFVTHYILQFLRYN